MKKHILIASLFVVGCGASHGFGEDAGEDADPNADASDDHKVGFKPDGGQADADPESDASDGGTTSDANDSGGTTGPRRVFVTFTSYDIGSSAGQFKGVSGADAICQGTANGQALGGTWKAWISSSAASVAARFTHTGGPFKMLDGTTIAKDWAELTSGTLQNKPSVDETGHPIVDQWAWTGTLSDGTWSGAATSCNDWTSSLSSLPAKHGRSDQTGAAWSGDTTTSTNTTCGDGIGFYCFEQ